jgi:hypothetical protein
LLNEATTADAKPALMLTAPPAAADTALSTLAISAAASVIAAVTANCQRRTMRIGLRKARSMALELSAPGKAEKV